MKVFRDKTVLSIKRKCSEKNSDIKATDSFVYNTINVSFQLIN